MKTIRICISSKDREFVLACGDCFSRIDDLDDYCWSCGLELDKDDDAYGFESLVKQINKIRKETT